MSDPVRSWLTVLDDVRASVAARDSCHIITVFLDAFGWRFAERHGNHPLMARFAREGVLERLRSQFPSTTVPHVTSMHTGLSVGAHGLYEWWIREPSSGRVIRPLPDRDIDHRVILPSQPTLYQQLETTSFVFQPRSFSPSHYDLVATRGAELRPFESLREGLEDLGAQLKRHDRSYALFYWPAIDGVGHVWGPDSPAFDAAIVDTLDALEETLLPGVPDGTLILLTADHGQIAVAPERFDALDVVWPNLPRFLTAPPAGSSRDVFLHVNDKHIEEVVDGLRRALGDRGTVHATSDLVASGWFGHAGPRLLERIGDVCVLPAAGRTAWLRGAEGNHPELLGHHGGVHPAELATFVGRLDVG